MKFQYLLDDCPNVKNNKGINIDIIEGYTPCMQCFHMHSHYEISFIISGDVSILLPEQISSGTRPRVVLLGPYTLHHMIPEPSQLYKRINVSFTNTYVQDFKEDNVALYEIFPHNGEILFLDTLQCDKLEKIFSIMDSETDMKQNRFLLLYTLSFLSSIQRTQKSNINKIPDYICKALQYLNEHYIEKVTAEELAKIVNVSRTTLMTKFRLYMGITIHQYQQNLRLKQAEFLRKQGMSVSEVASVCGFCDRGGYIRAYRKTYGVTPTGRE